MFGIIAEAGLSADAKWLIGLLVGAIALMWKDFRSMHKEGVKELRETNKQLAEHSTQMTLVETHTKETKHAMQNLPCKAIKTVNEAGKTIKVEREFEAHGQ